MAEAAHEVQGETTLKRIESYELLPPDMSEVRVVLLGNNQSERNKIGNILLGHTGFNEDGALSNCMTVSGVDKNSQMVVINTPDLLDPKISLEKLTEKVQSCVRCSDPGPHVFLLVLQPEDFTDKQRLRLQSILENFSHRSFAHSLVLVSTPRHQSTGHMLSVEYPPLHEMIRKCRYRHIQQKNLEHVELLTRLGQVVKENHEQHVHCDVYEDASGPTSADDSKRPDAVSSGPERAADSGLRIVLLGKSDNKKTTLGNLITKNQGFSSVTFPRIQSQTKQVADGEWDVKSVRVVKTTDLFSQSVGSVTKEIEEICASDCSPRPDVFLLLLKPSEFTEKDRHTLKDIMALFHQENFNNFIVIKTDEGHEANKPFKQTIQDCGGRLHSMTEDKIPSLMEKMKNIVNENKGRCLTSVKGSYKMTPKSNPPLNLVLFGTSGAGKTSAANAILGQTQYRSGSSSPTECVKRQAEVCGRWVTLVELPALYETSEEMIYNALRCVSLCDEGVHAFLLAVPLGALTDEDKAELKSIQRVFTSEINNFTRVVLTVESDPTAQAFVNFVDQDNDIKELCKSYGDHFVFNIKNSEQVPELLDAVEKMSPLEGKPLCFTKEMFIKAQMEKIIQQDRLITKLQAEGKKLEKPRTRDDDSQSLRMVLIGKTGSGKSASGNTILNQDLFTSKLSQKSVTKFCKKAHAEVDGRHVVVLDTPGLFDTSLSQEEVQQEMIKCISLLAPGPHVFLLVLEIGRFTEEEKQTLKLLQDAFGEDSKKFTIILLTGGDKLERNNQSTEDFIEGCDDSFRKLISDCAERYHVFNNVDGKNSEQVSDLLMKIDKMVKENGGGCYTTEMFQEAEAAIQRRMENILKEKEEEMKREVEALRRTHDEEKQKMRERMKEQDDEMKKERKKREKELQEKEEYIKKEREEREKERVKREEEDNKRMELEENKRNEWNEKLKALERDKQKASEEKDRELELKRKEMREQADAWEKERRAWLDKRRKDDEERREEQKRLLEEVDQERRINEKKRTEEDQKRQEEEKKKQQILKERKKEQEKMEMEDRKRKEEEENKLMEWKKKLEALERDKNIGSEEMIKQKGNWEKERERWNKKEQEDKERREEEKKEIKRLQEKFKHERKEHERKRSEEDTRRQEEEEAEKQRIVDEFRKKEKKEQQRREEEDRKRKTQDENKQKEWENKVKALETEKKKAEEKDRKLLENQKEMRKQREDWEQERTGWWNKREQEDKEQQKKIKTLQEEFDQEREKHEKTKIEEVKKIRQQEEDEREKLEKEHQEKLELMENEYKDEARKQAEKFNEFQEKYLKALEDLLQEQEAEIRDLELQRDTKAREFEDMKTKHEEQQKNLKKYWKKPDMCVTS